MNIDKTAALVAAAIEEGYRRGWSDHYMWAEFMFSNETKGPLVDFSNVDEGCELFLNEYMEALDD